MAEQLKVPRESQRWLANAQKDLKAARLLYQGELYSQAVFSLEQSIEKASKSFAFFGKLIDEKGAREISHSWAKLAIKSFSNVEISIQNIETSFKEKPEVLDYLQQHFMLPTSKDLEPLRNQLELLAKEDFKTLSTSRKRIGNYLSKFKKLDTQYESAIIASKERNLTDIDFRKIKRLLMKLLDIAIDNTQERAKAKRAFEKTYTKGLFERLITEWYPQWLKLEYAANILFYLGRLFSPHATSRYPEDDFDPAEFYTAELPLIQHFEKFLDITEKGLSNLGEVYSSYPWERPENPTS